MPNKQTLTLSQVLASATGGLLGSYITSDNNASSSIGGSIGGNSGGLNIGGSVGANVSGGTYTVKSGDTFSKIASKYGMTIAALKALNPQVSNINVISVGQVLRVSGSGSLGIGGNVSANTTKPIKVITDINTNTGQVQTATTPAIVTNDKNWFDKTFFDGAGALTGTAIAALIVLGVIVISKNR